MKNHWTERKRIKEAQQSEAFKMYLHLLAIEVIAEPFPMNPAEKREELRELIARNMVKDLQLENDE